MKYVVMLAVAFSCVSFEAECGFFGKGGGLSRLSARIEHEAQNFRDGTLKPVGKAIEHEAQNFRDGTIKPLRRNTISRFKDYLSREFVPAVSNFAKSFREIEEKIDRGETESASKDIQTLEKCVQTAESNLQEAVEDLEKESPEFVQRTKEIIDENQNIEISQYANILVDTKELENSGLYTTEDIRDQLDLHNQLLELFENRLDVIEKSKRKKLSNLRNQGKSDEEIEDMENAIDLHIAQEKTQISAKKLDILRIKLLSKKINKQK